MRHWPLGAVALAKVAASAVVLAAGFRAVSDDDYARVGIAEAWARAPRWDASGTSWLPFPFWVAGAAMKVAGRSLDTARVTAALLGVGAALLVYVAARWLEEDRRAAAAAAVVAAVFPWSARLGVATVPELLTAALSVLAMAALTPADGAGRRRILGGAALVAATLSRYEAWPVAAIFAGISLVEAVRAPRPRALAFAGAAALALAGPAAWLLNNRLAHGDALHFLTRVAAYRRALGEGGTTAPIWAYPLAVVREEPEIAALFAVATGYTAINDGLAGLRTRLAPYARPAAVTAATLAALWLAQLKDGAPTHHPERAVLAAMLLVAMAGGTLTTAMFARISTQRRRDAETQKNNSLFASLRLCVSAFLLPGLAMALAGWLVRGTAPNQGFADRTDEEAVGRAAASLTHPGQPVLVEVADYGYLAVEAAMGRPEDVVPDRSVDPRDAKTSSSFTDETALRARLSATGARWAVARLADPVRNVLGPAVTTHGAWGLFSTGAPP